MKETIIVLCAFFGLIPYQAKSQYMPDEFRDVLRTSIVQSAQDQNDQILFRLDSLQESIGTPAQFSNEDLIIAKRLMSIQKDIPLDYNTAVKECIIRFSSENYKPYLSKLLGLSHFYFPIYEQIFSEKNLPKEIKYLSVIESSLDPHLVSRSGAVGPWQFMYATAKGHNLTMNSYLDERKDPYAAGYAVTEYLEDAYKEFDDWLLALASYNCGRGCVRRAIKRSGIQRPSFWQLSPYLPQETRNYIPKYIAMTYVLEHADQHNIKPIETTLTNNYEVLMIDKHIELTNVANALNLPVAVLKEFNPAYKRTIINGSSDQPKRLIIPLSDERNDSLLYVALNDRVKIDPADGPVRSVVGHVENDSSGKGYMTYTVKKGDTLSGIASRHRGATVKRLRSDNRISGSHLKIGRKLRIAMSN